MEAALGSLSGTVTDSNQAAIASVVIEVIDPATQQVVVSTTTNPFGDYTISLVAEATYTVKVTPPVESGFAVATIPDVTVSGSTILDIVMVLLPPPSVTFSGLVQDRDLNPLPNWRVRDDELVRMHSSNVRGFSKFPISFEPV